MEEWTLSKVEVLVSSHIYSWEGRGGEFVHFDDPLTDGQRKRKSLVDLRSTLTYQRAKKIRALDPVEKKRTNLERQSNLLDNARHAAIGNTSWDGRRQAMSSHARAARCCFGLVGPVRLQA